MTIRVLWNRWNAMQRAASFDASSAKKSVRAGPVRNRLAAIVAKLQRTVTTWFANKRDVPLL